MLIEAIAAGVIGAALLWFVLQPMVATSLPPAQDIDPPDPEETPRGRALLALKEIEFDRATGKLSDADYAMLNARYSAAAVEALEVPTALAHCRAHGSRTEPDARFCGECGAGLLTAADSCVACGYLPPADALFCPGCGVALFAAE